MIVGQDRAVEQFASAWTQRKLHHAWLLAGPKGVGKASFAHAAARRVLADCGRSARPLFPGSKRLTRHPIVKLVEAGSHPDMRWLERLENAKTGNLARNITVDQVRELGEFLELDAGIVRLARGGDRQRSTSSNRRPPTRFSRCSRSRRPTPSSCSSATLLGGSCRPSAHAAEGSISSSSTMTP